MRQSLLRIAAGDRDHPAGGSARRTTRSASTSKPSTGWTDSNPLLARINPEHGPRLTALPCDLVWATTWMADANACIAP
ncbi:hypothetical protein ACFU9K_49270, partial [Streptomyces sp. NPDC057582]